MRKLKQYLKENASEIAQTISRGLSRKFPNKISIHHQDNLLTITFEVRKAGGRGALYQKGQLEAQEKPLRDKAVKISKDLMKELLRKIGLEDTSLDFDPSEPNVVLFLVSDSFVGMPAISVTPLKESISEGLFREESPPDATIEKWIKDNKERFKKEYGPEKGLQVLYAKAWTRYNNKK